MNTTLKTLVLGLCCLWGLNACGLESQVQTSTASTPQAPAASAANNQTSANLPSAEAAAQIDFTFTPSAEKQTVYFNSESQSVSAPAAGGYYREIIGKTEDGRTVAQDFYQDIGKPQTQPFILQKGADVNDFSSDTMDSKGVWFRPDGSLFQMQDFRAGKATGPAWYFENGQTIASVHEEAAHIDFYQNGKLIATWLTKDAHTEMRYFHPNGQTGLQLSIQNGEQQTPQAWDAAGQSVSPAKVRDEMMPLTERALHIFQAIQQDNNFVMGDIAQASAPKSQ